MSNGNFFFGTTNNLPIGLSDATIEEVYKNCYQPFIKLFYKLPHIKIVLHYSGHLLSWFAQHHSEFIDVIGEMVERKQVELLGNGFYDPVYAFIPRQDRVNQIEYNTTMVRKLFGKRVRGVWSPAMEWETFYPSMMYQAGISYTFLNRSCFKKIAKQNIYYPCIVEDEGRSVIVLPVDDRLRTFWDAQRFILFKLKLDINLLVRGEGAGSVCCCIGKGEIDWDVAKLEHIKKILTRYDAKLFTHPSEYLHKSNVRYWQGYFSCYYPLTDTTSRKFMSSEGQMLHARMNYTYLLARQVRGDRTRRDTAHRYIWQAQSHWFSQRLPCSDLSLFDQHRLWHNAYQAIIDAEKMTRERSEFVPALKQYDVNMDGMPEFIFEGRYLNIFVHIRGGMIYELDYLPASWNWTHFFVPYRSSRTAPYGAFIDYIMKKSVSVNDFHDGKRGGVSDGALCQREYEVVQYIEKKKGLQLSITHQIARGRTIRILKEYVFYDSLAVITYTIQNCSSRAITGYRFFSEVCCAPSRCDSDNIQVELYHEANDKELFRTAEICAADFTDVALLHLIDNAQYTRVSLEAGDAHGMWFVPVPPTHTKAAAPCLGVAIIPYWNIDIMPGEQQIGTIKMSVIRAKVGK